MSTDEIPPRGTVAKASSPSTAAARPLQDEDAFLRLGLILRCEQSEPRRIEAKRELVSQKSPHRRQIRKALSWPQLKKALAMFGRSLYMKKTYAIRA
jgi:hypothetical protein